MKRSKPIQAAPWTVGRAPRVLKPSNRLEPALRQQVWNREGGCCALCGERLSSFWQCHHRQLRSRGGQDVVSNLVALHTVCHERLHARPEWATEQGFMVASHDDPARMPVAMHLSRWVLLTDDGGYEVAA